MLARFVLVRRDGAQTSLAPLYDGPYRVLERSNHFFRLQLGDRMDNISILRLKAAHTPADTIPVVPPCRGRPPTLPPPPVTPTLPPPALKSPLLSHRIGPRSERHVQFRLPPYAGQTSNTDSSRPTRAVRPPV